MKKMMMIALAACAAAMMTVSDQVFGAKRADEETIQMGVERMIRVAVNAAGSVIE